MKTYAGELLNRNKLHQYLSSTVFGQASLDKIQRELNMEYTLASKTMAELVEKGIATKFKIGRKVIYKLK